MTITAWSYAVYLAVSIGLTIWVARSLSRNGRVFLVDVFAGREDLADSVNHLLVVGFYLLNLGFVCFALRVKERVGDATTAIEVVAVKVGGVLLMLGALHLTNVFVFHRIRSSGRHQAPPASSLPG